MRDKPTRAIAAAAIVAAGLAGPALPASAAPPAPPPPPSPGPAMAVTLVTGDQVRLDSTGFARVHAAPGREKVGFLTQRDVRGDVHVTPFDALAQVRSGRVDPRLFNVTELLADGYGDADRGDIPLIVTGSKAKAALTVRELPSVNGSAVRAGKNTAFWNARGDARIWLDGPMHATLDHSVPQIGAPAAWKAGYTGKNTTVAVLDTGIDPTHPDLTDAVAEAKDFTGSPSGTVDKFGHGTHVASIVTGGNNPYMGVAPDTKLLIGKVLDDRGSGTESSVLAGMEWAAHSGAQVINMSLGDDTPSDGTDLVSVAVNRLTAETGALFVVAAGNNARTPGSPAAADAALTVGAVDRNDNLADFSSRGPRYHDNAIKPEITAPGVDIVAALAKDSVIGQTHQHVGENHVVISGTSMATPHVAGAAAILAGEHPDWKAPRLKAALMSSAKPNTSLTVFEQGAGRVDVAKAVSSTVQASVGSISNGVVRWPHTDDQPIANALPYHNSGTSPVTLNLAADVRDPAGKPAPAGMFTVSPASLTLAPGASGQATVTTNLAVNGPDGIYTGVVTAGDIRTPITVTREVESYDVTLNFINTDGKPTSDYAYRLVSLTKPEQYVPFDASGTVHLRVPKDHYYLESQVFTVDGKLAVFIEPDLDLNTTKSVTVDPRRGKPAGITLERPRARPGEKFVEFARSTTYGGKDFLDTKIQPGEYSDIVVSPSQTTATGQFRYSVGGRFAEQAEDGSFNASPYLYNVRADVNGRMPTDPVLPVRDKDLVKVTSTHGATRPGTVGTREDMITKPLPYTLTEYYSPETPWDTFFSEQADGYVRNLFSSAPTSFPRVRTATDSYNLAVLGPDLPSYPGRPTRYASRAGDTMIFQIPLFSDSRDNREGYSLFTGTSSLSRNGVEIGRGTSASGLFNVPPGLGTFQLHVDVTRAAAVTSRVVADWTFTSDTVPDDAGAQMLPLMALKFAPTVDGRNQASRVLPSIVPVSVNHNQGVPAKPTSIQVSHDQGASWQRAPLITLDGRTFTVLFHPPGAKSVSLKASAQDQAGNSVTETIIDAYLLKP
ncbi:S8 family serine peptidase [Actinocrispum sp. NPDC049592]|uniref:S8 family peptidase n=1 Tax=Actinocrispum sp. NPDC049592 TaxID=3154835 RepID=UPI00342EE938